MKNKVKKAYVSISVLSFLSLITVSAIAVLKYEIYRKNIVEITTIVDNDKIKFQEDAYNILKEFKEFLENQSLLDNIEITNIEKNILNKDDEVKNIDHLENDNDKINLETNLNEKIKDGYKNNRGRIVYNKNNDNEYVFVYIKAKSGTEMLFPYKYNIDTSNFLPNITFIQL